MLSALSLNILIVEDNPGDQYLITDLLRSINTRIKNLFYAETIKESLEILKAETIDIILLDLSLPDSYGIDSYISIKKHSSAIPVVILSGFADMNLALEAITLGAQDYLIKGDFDEKFLAKTILYSIERVKAEEKLKAAEERKQLEITEAVIAAQENERQEIGRELHDNINQVLASALLYLGLDKDKTTPGLFNKKAEELVSTAIKEIRLMSHTLIAPSFEESGLLSAITHLLDTVTRTTGLLVHPEFEGPVEYSMSERQKLTIYRIIQEQLNNIQKYANANTIFITLKRVKRILTLIIKDDGRGFDIAQKPFGIGLLNIKTRAALFNGSMSINTAPGMGCELTVIFRFIDT